jgi:diguanylate cyclase
MSLLLCVSCGQTESPDTKSNPADETKSGSTPVTNADIVISDNLGEYDFGGEEFSVLLPNCTLSKSLIIAEKIRSSVEKNKFVLSNGKSIKITISIGVASYPETTAEVENLNKLADSALYDAKHSGRNVVCVNKSKVTK